MADTDAPKPGTPEFEKEVDKAVGWAKTRIDEALNHDKAANETKFKTYWDCGKRYNELSAGLSPKEKNALQARFVKGTDVPAQFWDLAPAFNRVFTEDQYKRALAAGMALKTMKSLVPTKQDNMTPAARSALIDKAIANGMTADQIRTLRGVKGARITSQAPKRRETASSKPPRSIFTTALDRAMLLEESVGFATDAVGRMSKLADKELADTTKILIQLRDKADDVSKTINQFLKFTSHCGKKGGTSK